MCYAAGASDFQKFQKRASSLSVIVSPGRRHSSASRPLSFRPGSAGNCISFDPPFCRLGGKKKFLLYPIVAFYKRKIKGARKVLFRNLDNPREKCYNKFNVAREARFYFGHPAVRRKTNYETHRNQKTARIF